MRRRLSVILLLVLLENAACNSKPVVPTASPSTPMISLSATPASLPALTLVPKRSPESSEIPLVRFPEATFVSTPDLSRPWPVYTNSKWGFSIEHPRAGITAHETIPVGETLPRFHATLSFISLQLDFVNVLVGVEDAPPDLSLAQVQGFSQDAQTLFGQMMSTMRFMK
jgi:hypothetical protein